MSIRCLGCVRLVSMFVLYWALFLLGVGNASEAADAKSATKLTIGKTAILFQPSPGFCFLKRDDENDRTFYESVGKAVADTNAVIAILADCGQLTLWREGARPNLDETLQLQVAKPFLYRDLKETRATVAKELCAQYRILDGDKSGSSQVLGVKSSHTTIQQRIDAAMKRAAVQEQTFLGVIEEAPDACYVGILQQGQLADGTINAVFGVMAVSIVRKKLVYYYRYSKFDNGAQVSAQLEQTKQDMQRLYSANK